MYKKFLILLFPLLLITSCGNNSEIIDDKKEVVKIKNEIKEVPPIETEEVSDSWSVTQPESEESQVNSWTEIVEETSTWDALDIEAEETLKEIDKLIEAISKEK